MSVGDLQKIDWAKLNEVSNAVAAKMNPPAGLGGPTPAPGTARPRVGAGPTVDGRSITLRSFYDVAPDISKNIPVLFGSVSEEGNSMSSRPTEAQWLATLTKNYGEAKGQGAGRRSEEDPPGEEHPDAVLYVRSQQFEQPRDAQQCDPHGHDEAWQKGAPAYAWYFTWQSPMLEDAGAWHTAELAFCFDNTKRCDQGTGNGPQAQALARKMATAWANFARSGDPSRARVEVGSVRAHSRPDDGLRQQLPDDGRSRRGSAQNPTQLTPVFKSAKRLVAAKCACKFSPL